MNKPIHTGIGTSTLLVAILAAYCLAGCDKPQVSEAQQPVVITVPQQQAQAAADSAPITVVAAVPGPMADVTPAAAPMPSAPPASAPVIVTRPAPAPTTVAVAPEPVRLPSDYAPQPQPGDTVMSNGGIGPQGAPAISGPDGATTIPYPGEPRVVNDRNSTNRIPDR